MEITEYSKIDLLVEIEHLNKLLDVAKNTLRFYAEGKHLASTYDSNDQPPEVEMRVETGNVARAGLCAINKNPRNYEDVKV